MSNKTPKEIWVSENQLDLLNWGKCLDMRVSNLKITLDDIKYLSEEYFKEELAKKDKEIERLKDIAIAYIRNNKKNQ